MSAKTLYILKCSDETWYVGTTVGTRHIYDIYEEHLRGEGAAWTALHKPLCITETKETDRIDQFEEDMLTKRLMLKYGINKVRGGSYVAIKLPDYQMKALKQELCTAGNLCFKCGSSGHFANQCIVNNDVCFRCGQMGHFGDLCPKREVLMPIPDDEFAMSKLAAPVLYNIIEEYNDMTLSVPGYSIVCGNCGINGHMSADCNITSRTTNRCGPLHYGQRIFVAPERHHSCNII